MKGLILFASREFNDSTANPATITLVLGTASIGMDALVDSKFKVSKLLGSTAEYRRLGVYLEAPKFNDSTVIIDLELTLETATLGVNSLATVGAKDLTVMTDVGTSSIKNVETSRVNVVAPKVPPSVTEVRAECLYLESPKFKGSTVLVDTATRVFNRNTVYQVDPVALLTVSDDTSESLGAVDTTVGK